MQWVNMRDMRQIRELVRVGVIGCGGVGSVHHWPSWNQLPNMCVTAVADVRTDLAQSAARAFGARAYPSYSALIEDAKIDALFIFLPPFAHGEPELLAVERGLPFFVEKPVALSLTAARQVVAALHSKPLITSVGYHWRYDRAVEIAKTTLGERKVALIQAFWMGSAARRALPAWWRDKSLSGGQIIEQSTHMVDLLRYFAGEVSTVYCQQVHRLVEASVPDACATIVQFASGALGSLVNGCSLPENSFRAGLSIVANDLFMEVSRGSLTANVDGRTSEFTAGPEHSNNPYFLEDRAFIEAVRTGDTAAIRSSYSDAARTLAVTIAAEESSRLGRSVAVE